MNNLQENRLFSFLLAEGFSEDQIVTAVRTAQDIGQLAELLEMKHPVLPGRAHPIIRVPEARLHFLEAKHALERL